jgi:Pyridoxamine 5'-phosphate oxidase
VISATGVARYAGTMTVKVDLAGLGERIDELGPGAFLVTVGGDGRPHVVSVQVDRDGERLTMPAGRTTRANLAARPAATLLWPAPAGADYSLLVDGTADDVSPGEASGEGPVTIVPASAILHRVADATGSGPTCLPVTP